MERRNTSNDIVNSNVFEYSFPIHDADADESEEDSNKSTPYYTPLDFFQSSFEFPSPKPAEKCVTATSFQVNPETLSSDSVVSDSSSSIMNQDSMDSMAVAKSTSYNVTARQMSQTSIKQAPPLVTSPAVSRKLRRFSLYERRSCSPQHLLTRNAAGSVDLVASELPSPVDDKENAKPPQFFDQSRDEMVQMITRSGNSSPIILKDESASPKIPSSDGLSRHNFSPKLLASINNLKLANSPLGIISSAGYKNGNYFKFPEIDNVVQENATGVEITTAAQGAAGFSKNTNVPTINFSSLNKSRFISSSLDSNQDVKTNTGNRGGGGGGGSGSGSGGIKNENDRKNRKNKNNLTIQITETPVLSDNITSSYVLSSPSPSPSPPQSPSLSPSPAIKPKTPTIKSTKEKALSLDSAAYETTLSLVIKPGESQSHVSCDEIDSKINFSNNNKNGGSKNNSQTRQKNVVAGNRERDRDRGDRERERDRIRPSIPPSLANRPSSVCSTANSQAVYRAASHKPSPLLHSSNANLKTLPEFLLVEFSTSSPKDRELCPFKQKSMDLPSTSTASTTRNLRTKTSAAASALASAAAASAAASSSSSGSLLQRRGSNHSLTLNLHGSCGNLLGSCRGLSVSNYNLGSTATNSTTNLNLKSNFNSDVPPKLFSLRQTSDISNTANTLQPNPHPNLSQNMATQGAKQTLFRRRGSNQSLTLKNSANSCGNLNTFASQNSLNVDRSHMNNPAGVTRTTSFVTPTKNHPSSNTATPKRGLLERRGSNQSLTLNMTSSFGGIGNSGSSTDRADETSYRRNDKIEPSKALHPQYCAQHHKKFFSSENLNLNLNKSNTQNISDFQTECHNVSRPFGSASDLKVSACAPNSSPTTRNAIEESDICCCTGMRNIMTRPLSPQRKAEEFKTYLANIQTLQNASNVLKQHDLIKLNYIFDNSYASNSKSLQEVLPIVLGVEPSSSSNSLKDVETSSSNKASGVLTTTSEDCEIATRYEEAVRNVLESLNIDVEEQKRIFRDLHKEFWDLPLNHQEKPLVFGSQAKNRYKTILPNETTRVILQKESMQLTNFGGIAFKNTADKEVILDSDDRISSYGVGNKLLIDSAETPYINANYIKGPDATTYSYVATQGPLSNTIFEFWLMAYQNIRKQMNCSAANEQIINMTHYYQKLVMLTNFQEHHRQKCVVYFPVELNEIFIANSKQTILPNIDILKPFFDKYFKINDDFSPTGSNKFIENFEIEDLDESIRECLPPNGNCFVIKNVGIVRKNGFSIRKMIVLYCMIRPSVNIDSSSSSMSTSNDYPARLLMQRFFCYHYWYPDWPDHRSPKDINTLLDICLHILNLGKCEAEFNDCGQMPTSHINSQTTELYQLDLFNTLQPLPIIHCSAGVGRTGCLTAILNGIRQMRQALAYSLTMMAADVSNEKKKNIKSGQPLSPIDFRIPHQFFVDNTNFEEYNNDTDSSFTRNTLLFINYIIQKYNAKRRIQHITEADFHRKIPSLTELPQMPDIIVDILGIVCNLRLSRGGMVQNSEQYELIHRALCLYLKRTLALKRF